MTEKLLGCASEVELELKTIKALQLREGGAKYRQIADQMAIPLTRAFRLVERGLAEFHAQVEDTAERMRYLELNRLDTMWIDLSVSKDGQPVEQTPRVVEAKLKIMERRAKLLGLDAPVQVSGPGGGPIQFQDVDAREEIRRRVMAIRVRISGGESVEVAVAEEMGAGAAPVAGALPEVAG